MEKKTYRRKCSGRFEKWAVGCSPFFTSKEQSGLRVSADKERRQGALFGGAFFLTTPQTVEFMIE